MTTPELLDVLIVGAGISGIGSAYHLRTQCPGKSFRILEAMPTFGGTWVTHRYPGTRSDSDLHTYGYRFKPWTGAPIATREQILKYLEEVVVENDLARHIAYQHRIGRADWSSADNRWHIEGVRTDTGEPFSLAPRFLWMCQGYYRHDAGYTPQWPGRERFQGRIVHPQAWPDDLDLTGKKVVVIGSGATAATLIPAIAPVCERVTLLQRSPTYYFPGKNVSELANMLRSLEIPEEWIHEIVRRKILQEQGHFIQRTFTEPEVVIQELLAGVKAFLGDGPHIAEHFTPRYRPWQQRLALIPDGDLFRTLAGGKAAMATGEIETFDEAGLVLKSGQRLDADIIVTATGFNLNMMGDIAFSVDGEPVDFANRVGYRALMFTGVPNLAWVFGYLRASWTLRVDLVGDFVCRLLRHMDARSATRVTPTLRPQDADMPLLPWILPENFNSNYLARSLHLLPKQGDRSPWLHTQDYHREKKEMPAADLEDGLAYS